jgi:hypothetical protein
MKDELEFITQSLWKAVQWEKDTEDSDDKYSHTRYYKEFDLQ